MTVVWYVTQDFGRCDSRDCLKVVDLSSRNGYLGLYRNGLWGTSSARGAEALYRLWAH